MVEDELYSERFLVRRPLLAAIDYQGDTPPVLLVDEVDRADDEFEAFLLEILSDYSVSVPELGTFHADVPPIVVVTSNRTRDLHDALKRRCLYHWISHPSFERELGILRLRAPNVPPALARQVAAATEALRMMELYKPPGVAETIDWAQSLSVLGTLETRPALGRDDPGHGPQVPGGPGTGAQRRGVRAAPGGRHQGRLRTGWRASRRPPVRPTRPSA